MQEQPTADRAQHQDTADAGIMCRLLVHDDHRPWSVEELIRDRDNNAGETRDAIARLQGLGLIHLTVDGLVFPTRAALYLDQLPM
jgi:hypothetical protein